MAWSTVVDRGPAPTAQSDNTSAEALVTKMAFSLETVRFLVTTELTVSGEQLRPAKADPLPTNHSTGFVPASLLKAQPPLPV